VEPVAEVVLARPAAALRPYVETYTAYRMEGFAPGLHRGLPGRHLTFIVSLGPPVDLLAMPDPKQPARQLQAFVSGYDSAAATIAHDGNQHGIALDVTPRGARLLLGLPAAELAGICVSLDEVLGARGGRLSARLQEAADWTQRFALLDEELLELARKRRIGDPRPEVVAAWDQIVATGGTVEVGALAAELGWSRRHLGERFRAELGLTPKVAARVVRFERARRILTRPERPALADVAHLVGYYDQAHLNRDFREIAGCSPTTWLAEELPSVQDPGGAWIVG
jgi:AraC-like DNA-binding protein